MTLFLLLILATVCSAQDKSDSDSLAERKFIWHLLKTMRFPSKAVDRHTGRILYYQLNVYEGFFLSDLRQLSSDSISDDYRFKKIHLMAPGTGNTANKRLPTSIDNLFEHQVENAVRNYTRYKDGLSGSSKPYYLSFDFDFPYSNPIR